MSHAQPHSYGIHDPDFQPPSDKHWESTQPKPSGLSIFSLWMGVVSVFVPFFAPVVAVVTGHVALRDIRQSGGRIGGRSYAQVGLILGYFWLALTALVAAGAILFTMRYTAQVDHLAHTDESHTYSILHHDLYSQPGVKLANELSPSYVEWLRESELVTSVEPIVVAYEAPSDSIRGPDVAVVTTKKVVYIRGQNVVTLDLAKVADVAAGADFYEKLDPDGDPSGINDYMVGVIADDGQVIRVRMPNEREGSLFASRLQSAWKAARIVDSPPARESQADTYPPSPEQPPVPSVAAQQ